MHFSIPMVEGNIIGTFSGSNSSESSSRCH
jgi:hypothetical protein